MKTFSPADNSFSEGNWLTKNNGARVNHQDCIQVLQEIFQANTDYWNNLRVRIKKGIQENKLTADFLPKFDEIVSLRDKWKKNLKALDDLAAPGAYNRAKTLKDAIIAMRYSLGGFGADKGIFGQKKTPTEASSSTSSSNYKASSSSGNSVFKVSDQFHSMTIAPPAIPLKVPSSSSERPDTQYMSSSVDRTQRPKTQAMPSNVDKSLLKMAIMSNVDQSKVPSSSKKPSPLAITYEPPSTSKSQSLVLLPSSSNPQRSSGTSQPIAQRPSSTSQSLVSNKPPQTIVTIEREITYEVDLSQKEAIAAANKQEYAHADAHASHGGHCHRCPAEAQLFKILYFGPYGNITRTQNILVGCGPDSIPYESLTRYERAQIDITVRDLGLPDPYHYHTYYYDDHASASQEASAGAQQGMMAASKEQGAKIKMTIKEVEKHRE
ncbi:hypothetical protein G7Y89_g89 [Cudoniella acicularis]|uniref:Uncharacterized protein n=1 Tax=Cudoniella acicularis TaxID=354080 RepID=A0A8H4W8M4_9HELO|nr:hypothetical protein G7Y89_g89 [Cudoniella acicularis]